MEKFKFLPDNGVKLTVHRSLLLAWLKKTLKFESWLKVLPPLFIKSIIVKILLCGLTPSLKSGGDKQDWLRHFIQHIWKSVQQQNSVH